MLKPNATIVDPRGCYQGSIAISGEKVVGILAEASGNAARTIDAEGLVALPGMVGLFSMVAVMYLIMSATVLWMNVETKDRSLEELSEA